MRTNGDTKRQGKRERTTETREKRQRRENQEIKQQRHLSNDRYRSGRKREGDLCFLPCIPIAFGQSCKTVDMTLVPEMHIELNWIAYTPLSAAILLATPQANHRQKWTTATRTSLSRKPRDTRVFVWVSLHDRMRTCASPLRGPSANRYRSPSEPHCVFLNCSSTGYLE